MTASATTPGEWVYSPPRREWELQGGLSNEGTPLSLTTDLQVLVEATLSGCANGQAGRLGSGRWWSI